MDNQRNTYAAVAAAGGKQLHGPMREAVLSAIYNDLHARESMKNNFVIYGLPPKQNVSDKTQTVDLCHNHLGVLLGVSNVVRAERLGKSVPNKVQPLLVSLTDAQDSVKILSRAKGLRDSTDRFVKDNVFISAQQTRAERQASYEARVRRRQQTATRAQQQQSAAGQSQRLSTGAQAPPTTVAAAATAAEAAAVADSLPRRSTDAKTTGGASVQPDNIQLRWVKPAPTSSSSADSATDYTTAAETTAHAPQKSSSTAAAAATAPVTDGSCP